MLGNLGKSSIAMTILAAISTATFPAQAALLVSNSGDNSIKQYDDQTGAYIRDFVTSGSGGLSSPQGLALGPNGNLFVVSGDNTVKEYRGTTGEYISNFVSLDEPISLQGLSFGEDGSLFVVTSRIPGTEVEVAGPDIVSWSSGVLKYDGTTGELIGNIPTSVTGNNLVATGPQPVDVAVGGPDDNLFISLSSARFNSGGIREYDPTTGAPIRGIPIQVQFLSPRNLAVNDRNLFYTDSITARIGRIDLATGTADTSFIASDSGGLRGPSGIAIGENGNLFVSSSGTNSIKQYDSATGDFLGDFVASSSGGLSRPTYLTTANVPVPEPSSVLGLMAFGGLFAGSVLRRKISDRHKLAALQK